MADTETTHDVAEKTDAAGGKVRTETVRTETREVKTSRGEAEDEGEPKQIKPDGR